MSGWYLNNQLVNFPNFTQPNFSFDMGLLINNQRIINKLYVMYIIR